MQYRQILRFLPFNTMADESKSRRSWLQAAVAFLPRIELLSILSNYGTDFGDKLAGDLSSGIVVAGENCDQLIAIS